MKEVIRQLSCYTVALIFVAMSARSAPLQIELKHGSTLEQQTRDQLNGLFLRDNLDQFAFTHSIVIEDRAVPHSDPVLTLNTRYLGQDDRLVSSFLHEQLHWYADARAKAVTAAVRELRAKYPQVPFGNLDGAATEESTYLHIIVCSLELDADRKLLGEERTAALLVFLKNDHYRWVYRRVDSDRDSIHALLAAHNLSIWDALAYRQSLRTNGS